MDYQVSATGTQVVVTVKGRLTFSDAANFPKVLAEITKPDVTGCAFDMAALDFIDSTGMSLLIHAYDKAKEAGFKVTLRNAAGSVRAALDRAGFPALFDMA